MLSHLIYGETYAEQYPLCILVPRLMKDEIRKEYLSPYDIAPKDVLALNTYCPPGKKKPSNADIKEFIKEALLPTLEQNKVQYILCADGEYFKVLTKTVKIEPNLGYVLDCVFGDYKVVYVPNFQAIFYDPEKIRAKIKQGMEALVAHVSGTYESPGTDIIKFEAYPQTDDEVADWLQRLLDMNVPLTCDIEAFSLKHNTAGIGTITFCWNQNEGIAFAVDYVPIDGATEAPYGVQGFNTVRRNMLRVFFENFQQKMMYHFISYDAYVLIYQLFMESITDTEGLLYGMEIMLRNWDDTKLITYLATNSCAGNDLSLKTQAQEFAGNWAQTEINDITRIPLDKLLRYNLVDGLSTWFTYEKRHPQMIADEQGEIYQTLFKPAIKDIIQMQLTGMPLDKERVTVVKKLLTAIESFAIDILVNSNIGQKFTYKLNEEWVDFKNATLKKKRVTLADAKETFNPNSGPQLQRLLFQELGLPVLGLTDTKQPSTGGEIIKDLQNHTQDPDVLDFLRALIDYKAVSKLLTSFIPAMENAAQGPDGWHYLFGYFNLGGTVSGRLSSSDPNLQNLPANIYMTVVKELMEKYGEQLKPFMEKGKLSLGKLIKWCFAAPPGWLFCGLDFNSLEDRISALTTKDPNKLKVYTDGYDGHCLRAFTYFGEQMPDIDPNSVDSINSIDDKYKALRQESKAPTFALTYQGTFITLMTNCGFSKEKAQLVERRYKELYRVSIDWVSAKLDEASKTGYVIGAFGLKVRTPMLVQVVRGTSRTPFEAEAEGRTAGNALGQSWCLLNTRASVEFMDVVRAGPHRLDIRPCAHIHDAQYMLVRDDIAAILYANKHLVKAVEWQEHPDIYHPDVKLGGEFSIFYPSWDKEIGIPNGASEADVFEAINKAMEPKK